MVKVFIDGRAGTTGLRIYERIAMREDVSLLSLDEAQRKDTDARREILRSADIAFLCLPDEAAREACALAEGAGTRIIDASTAHRTTPGWAYGFPELSPAHRQGIVKGSRVAVPGCHASGFIALVYPLIAAGALPKEALLSCTSITGYSGGGKPMITEYSAEDACETLRSPRHYATVQAHKHLPEMQIYSGLTHMPVFNPVLGNFYAGMLVSVPLHMCQLQGVNGLMGLQALYEAHYAGQNLVRVLPFCGGDTRIPADGKEGKDDMELFFTGNEERVTLFAWYDNLGKGASGAAIQCMNLMLGQEECKGLSQ